MAAVTGAFWPGMILGFLAVWLWLHGAAERAEDEYEMTFEFEWQPDEPAGDPGFHEVLAELGALHAEKASGYGTDVEPFANYVETSEALGEPDEYTAWVRIHEKCVRALNLIRAGRANENEEGTDVAALAIGAEALRRRRL